MFLVLLIGCGKGGLEGEMKKFRDETCACSDLACAKAVEEGFLEWVKPQAEKMKAMSEDERQSFEKEQGPALKAIEKEMRECRRALKEGKSGDTLTGASSASCVYPTLCIEWRGAAWEKLGSSNEARERASRADCAKAGGGTYQPDKPCPRTATAACVTSSNTTFFLEAASESHQQNCKGPGKTWHTSVGSL